MKEIQVVHHQVKKIDFLKNISE